MEKMAKLIVVPVSLKEANAFIERHHRHHKPVVGHKFSIGCAKEGKIVGVAIVGRPVSRHLDNGWILEVVNAASCVLYSISVHYQLVRCYKSLDFPCV